jgi:hypothetical protein
LPMIKWWLEVEVIYQYSQILYYLLSNLFVIYIILYRQHTKAKQDKLEQETREQVRAIKLQKEKERLEVKMKTLNDEKLRQQNKDEESKLGALAINRFSNSLYAVASPNRPKKATKVKKSRKVVRGASIKEKKLKQTGLKSQPRKNLDY